VIARLEGRLVEVEEGAVIVMVNGVGFRLYMSTSTLSALPERGADVSVYTHLRVRDDGIDLYGFLDREERAAFEQLVSVSGVGPRAALAVLSSVDAAGLRRAVACDDAERLMAAPGIGEKTARRIILELKGKIGEAAPTASKKRRGPATGPVAEAVEALAALGYAREEALPAVEGAVSDGAVETGEIVRKALKLLGRDGSVGGRA